MAAAQATSTTGPIDLSDDGSISMSQTHYIRQMLERFSLTDIDPKRKVKVAYAKAEPKASLNATSKPFRALLGCRPPLTTCRHHQQPAPS